MNSLLENNKNASILDVACGTGFVGEFLYEKGFQNLYGLEPSEGMASAARAKNLYKNIFVDKIYADKATCVNGKKGFFLILLKLRQDYLISFFLKTTNYKYSIPEYGVHWNFFFTIFFVKVRRTLIKQKGSCKILTGNSFESDQGY